VSASHRYQQHNGRGEKRGEAKEESSPWEGIHSRKGGNKTLGCGKGGAENGGIGLTLQPYQDQKKGGRSKWRDVECITNGGKSSFKPSPPKESWAMRVGRKGKLVGSFGGEKGTLWRGFFYKRNGGGGTDIGGPPKGAFGQQRIRCRSWLLEGSG